MESPHCNRNRPPDRIRPKDRPTPDTEARQSPEVVFAHETGDAVFAARLSSLTQIQEHPQGAIDAVARDERRAVQAEYPGIFVIVVRDRLLEPRVVTALGHTEFATNRLHAVSLPMSLNKSVPGSDLLDGRSCGHRLRPPLIFSDASFSPLNPGNSTHLSVHRHQRFTQGGESQAPVPGTVSRAAGAGLGDALAAR